MCELGYCGGGYDARPFEMYFELTLTVNPGAETGDGGVLEVVVLSTKNAANRSGAFDISLDVQILYDFEFDRENTLLETDIIYTDADKVISVNLTNTGNIEADVAVFTSEGFRGWLVNLDEPSGENNCELEVKDFICTIDEGQTITIELTIIAPSGASTDNTYKFTLSAEPVETGVVDRVNLEFTMNGKVDPGFFGLGLTSSQVTTYGSGFLLLLLGLIIVRTVTGRSRS